MVFADIAEQLYDADSFDEVLSRIAEAAVSTIAGCRMASVTLLERSGYRTAASTDPAATAVDQAQYQVHEGPAWTPSMTQWCTRRRFPMSAGRHWHHVPPNPA
jgi:hypothetical protein